MASQSEAVVEREVQSEVAAGLPPVIRGESRQRELGIPERLDGDSRLDAECGTHRREDGTEPGVAADPRPNRLQAKPDGLVRGLVERSLDASLAQASEDLLASEASLHDVAIAAEARTGGHLRLSSGIRERGARGKTLLRIGSDDDRVVREE